MNVARLGCGLILVLVTGADVSRAEEASPTRTVTISGDVRPKKNAPVFLRLLALDSSGKEYVARERVIELTAADVARGSLRYEFAGLQPGSYALKAFQDTNGNKKLDIGVFGPKEPWATYRHARPKLRPPRFEEMAFDAQADVADAQLVMR